MERHDIVVLTALTREWDRLGLSRRDLLRLLVAGAGTATIASIVAACGGTPPTPTPLATATAISGQATTVPTATGRAASPASGPAVAGSPVRAGSPAASPVAAAAGYPAGGKYSTLEAIGRRGGHITEVGFAEANTFNPIMSTDQASGPRIAMIFNSLLGVNPDSGLPFPDLAVDVPTKQNGGISADGLTYTFKLRQGIKWHDGQPLTARDIAFTYETVTKKDLGSGRTGEASARIDSVATPDASTVVIKLKKVIANFLTLNMYGIVPEHILKDVPVDRIKSHPFSVGDPKATIGTGPFKFQEFVRDDHLTLVKNREYFRGEPALDEYIFKVVKDSNVVVTQLKSGEADYGAITETFYDELGRLPNLRVDAYDLFSFDLILFQLDPAKTTLFQDKRVRQGLAYALDREGMVKAIRFGRGQVAHGTMPPPSWAYAPDRITIKYTYDPRKAEQLLDEAGWTKGADGVRARGGQQMRFDLWLQAGRKDHEQFATAMQQQWKQIGVEANLKAEERTSFLTRIIETHDLDMSLNNFSYTVDPDQSTAWKTNAYVNVGRYSNPRVDALLDQALSELDQDKRKELYLEMQNILADELPALLLDFPQGLQVVNKRVHNLRPNAVSVRWNPQTWWVDDGR